MRRFIYGTRTPKDLKPIIEDAVEGFFAGAGTMMKRIVAEGDAAPATKPAVDAAGRRRKLVAQTK